MSIRKTIAAALAGAALLVGCKEQTPIPHTPAVIKIVSGGNQSADVSSALDSTLVVQVLDAASLPVAGVSVTWTAGDGGSITPVAPTTDGNGKASAKWTLGPAVGNQVVTVTSSQIVGVSVSFVANNGATINGTIAAASGLPYATFSKSPSRSASLSASASTARKRRFAPGRLVIGFKNDALGVSGAASTAYRSMTVARQAAARIQESVTALSSRHAFRGSEISPALLAARVKLADTSDIEGTMAALRAEPDVAWVERDEIISIHDGAPRAMSTDFLARFSDERTSTPLGVATKLPSDPGFYEQLWTANMLDLPRAWGITTGSNNVIVASIDMGIRFDHPEVTANLTNDGYDFVSQIAYDGTTQPICGGGSFVTIDGDGDGPDANPTDPDDLAFDTFNNCWAHSTLGDHGLWTAGIIGGVGNDGVGMAGVNWSVKIRPIRVLGITGEGTNFDIAQGVLYAAGLPAVGANGAQVQAPSRAQIINMSLGGPGTSTSLGNAISAASAAGCLIVASAGNDGLDFPSYPAAYPSVMGVAAVGMDGVLSTYSNAGTFISVSAPGGDFRLDDNGGGGVLGPGWNFSTNKPTYLFGYGTSASAPFVSGIAALVLAQNPSMTAAALRSRIEQYATRPTGMSRSDSYGWGIANAYNALTSQNGAPHATLVRLINSTTGAVVKTTTAAANGTFSFTRVATGTYYVQAGDDESGDASIGVPGRRFTWAGGFGTPTVLNVNANAQSVAIPLGLPTEVEPNDDIAHANFLTPDSYVIGSITTPDVRDMYALTVVTGGTYTIETSGLTGSCGLGIELDTFISVASQAGATIASNDNFSSATSRFCSRVQTNLTPGIYYITVTGSTASGLADHGRYRLQVRTGN